ncbi:hypothetical protein TELCIR_03174 [Teladorsagia circumcincta]|uniref:Gamma-glutamyltranspeptidase n=1 Tax=Teladorsagia circumcincta TaxID=45464 RepID=A0A2G9UX14_TELCI|nr:hypothetical protein TELCIR_03174 [Teladorsagia circumcincta]
MQSVDQSFGDSPNGKRTFHRFGFAPSETNFIEPGKRPMSSMSPMPTMVIGGSGGSKIISAVAKAIVRPLIFGETIKQAIDSPMIHNQFTPDITQIDDAFPKEWQRKEGDTPGSTRTKTLTGPFLTYCMNGRRSASVVTLLLSFVVASTLNNIDWCQYFRILKRDHMRPECNGLYRLQLAKHRDHTFAHLPPLQHDFIPSFRRFVNQRASITEMTKKALGIREAMSMISPLPSKVIVSTSGESHDTPDTMDTLCYSLSLARWA